MNKTLAIAALTFLVAASAEGQCTKDTECKGDRVCERGVCVAPNTTAKIPGAQSSASSPTTTIGNYPRFEDFSSAKYAGPIVGPKGTKQISATEWRNEMGKLVEPPVPNFAGKYNITLNSCGTGCRYYTLTDLSTGKSLPTLAPFAAAEPPPKTKDGYAYITDLIGRAESYMLVAQAQVEAPKGVECRERIFKFQGQALKPITNTKVGCTKF